MRGKHITLIEDYALCRAALEPWTTALLSWTSFTLNFVIRNPHRMKVCHESGKLFRAGLSDYSRCLCLFYMIFVV